MTTLLALLALASAPLTMDKTVDLPKKGRFDAMAYDADHHRILAAHSGAGTLTVLDTQTGGVQEIETGAINGIAVSKKLDRYFAAGDGKALVAIDRKTLKVVGRAPLSSPGDLVAVDARRGQVYVAHDGGTENWVFDGATLSPVGTVPVETGPEFLEYDEATDRIYENIKSTDHLQVIDPATRKVVATWSTAPATLPHGLALDKKAGRVYAAGKNGKLVALDTTTGKVVQTLDVATGTDGIAIDARLGRVYVPGKGKMTVVSTVHGASMGEVGLPSGAKNVAVDTATHTAWANVNDERGSRLVSFKAAP